MKIPGKLRICCQKKNGVENSPVWWFYKGFLKKRGAKGCFFVVKNVVKGVIKLEHDAVFRGEGKYATDFRFIFGSRLDLLPGDFGSHGSELNDPSSTTDLATLNIATPSERPIRPEADSK